MTKLFQLLVTLLLCCQEQSLYRLAPINCLLLYCSAVKNSLCIVLLPSIACDFIALLSRTVSASSCPHQLLVTLLLCCQQQSLHRLAPINCSAVNNSLCIVLPPSIACYFIALLSTTVSASSCSHQLLVTLLLCCQQQSLHRLAPINSRHIPASSRASY